MARKKTRPVKVGNKIIGGFNPIVVQSMTNTDTRDTEKTINQIKQLEKAGCEIVRIAVPDEKAALAIKKIKSRVDLPLIADIHFNYRLALLSIDMGIDGLRINPGNIGGYEKLKIVVDKAKKYNIPIRVGVNSGSLEKDILFKYGKPTAEAMVESAIKNIETIEKFDFKNIIVSLKSSDVLMTIKANQMFSEKMDYPLHLGVTEAGTKWSGTIKSAVGIGSLLSNGIGDTIRVSLTGDPVEEVKVGLEILKSLGLRHRGVEIISCPTCGRTCIDIEKIAKVIEEKTKHITKPLKIAVMGCVVNGPGEAKEADIGIAGGKEYGILFKKGRPVKKVKESEIINQLLYEVNRMVSP